MVDYRPPTRTENKRFEYWNHTSLKIKVGSTQRLKMVDGTVKKGSEIGLSGERGEKEVYVFEVMLEDGSRKTWTVDLTHHIGEALATLNIQTGEIFTVTYLGEIMKTQHGLKSKYEVKREGALKSEGDPKDPVSEMTKEEVTEIMNEPEEEPLRIEDIPE